MIAHVSIEAERPEHVARILARIMGGEALPFPPCDGAWIAFAAADDGTAVEVYPQGARVMRGPETIAFEQTEAAAGPSATHVAIGSPLSAEEIIEIGQAEGWTTRSTDRGPFGCIELWIEDRVLIELLDPAMQEDYRRNMTVAGWRAMFGM
jgi:hypothetical protein